MSHAKVLFILSGSIACYKACEVISKLAQAGVEVQTVATEAALRFVGPATLEGLTGRRVLHNLWEEGRALDHISRARDADLAIICPATANTINRLAAGLADDLAGSLFLAWEHGRKPWYLAPAMNTMMWAHPATQAGIGRLKGWGVRVIEPDAGSLACGETGPGRLAEPALIIETLSAALSLPRVSKGS
ncbi:coenzyme A biosynthesis bifunctional protein CoaBC [mine drainage metagenome]|uniref:Coenzyme A biosynthesis bifunctional protein CoaBC n=1 Tax=mine drainage metagenome TaxID=410659 RepID=A0A1J5SRN2_9ZZZZ